MRRLALIMGLLAACGGANSEALALQQARLARAKHEDAAKAAPELFARFEATQKTAYAQSPGSAARRDYENEARLWLEAAISEAERRRLSEARQSVERETAAFDAAALEDDRARAELAERAEREAAREVVRRESELALARAALAPQQRVKLGRAEVEQAAQALIARAALIQLALLSWDISAPALAPLGSSSREPGPRLPRIPTRRFCLPTTPCSRASACSESCDGPRRG
jgi:hypothetical protein